MIIGDMEIRLRADIARLQRDMDQARRVVNDTANGIGRAAESMKMALAGIGLGVGLGGLARMADEYNKFTAQLRLATTSQREYAVAMDDVRRIANSAQQDIAATGTLYARIANGTRELGIQQKQVAKITETVNLSLLVSGATASESASAQLQLSQAFASGTLRGEEFNAVNEAAPRLMKALADGMGLPVGALKEMASNGEITSKIMAEVLPDALVALREEMKQIQTIGGAMTVLKNRTMELVGVQAQASGAVATINSALDLLGRNIGFVVGAIATLAAAKLGSSIAAWTMEAYRNAAASNAQATATLAAAVRTTEAAATTAAAKLAAAQADVRAAAAASNLAAARVAELRASVLAAEGATALAITTNGLIPAQARLLALEQARTAALAAQAVAAGAATTTSVAATAALGAQAAAATLATRAMTVLRGAMSMFGGPIGVIITLLGAAAMAWSHFGDKAKDSNKDAAESFEEAQVRIVKGLDEQIAKQEALLRLKGQGTPTQQADKEYPIIKQIEEGQKRVAEMEKTMRPAAGESLKDFSDRYRSTVAGVLELQNKLVKAREDERKVGEQSTADRVAGLKKEMATNDEKRMAELKAIEDLKEKTADYDDLVARINKKYDGKGAASALAQEENAYKTLITSINEKIASNNLEISGVNALTDAQKMTIKLDAEIASGKSKLSPESIKSARNMIEELAATDALLQKRVEVIAANKLADEGLAGFMKTQKEHDEQVAKSIQAAQDEAAKNEELVVTFGMSKTAIEEMELARLESQYSQRVSNALTQQEIADLEALIAAKQRNVAAVTKVEGFEAAKKSADELAQFLDPTKAETFGDALRDAFGGAGSALVKLTTSFQTYAKKQAEFDKQREAAEAKRKGAQGNEADYIRDISALNKMQAKEQLQGYGDMAAGAAGFFGEQSKGYKALTTMSQVFHAAELAMTLAELVPKGISAVLSQGQGDPYSAFARMAAMAAIVAGLGVAISGGGGGKSVSQQRQESQGTGTVFGDSTAKSDSIKRALELMSDNSSIELSYTRGMLNSLRSIESSMSGLGNLLVRTSGLTGVVEQASSGGWLGKIGNSIFGGKTTVEDTGFKIDPTTFARAMAGDLNSFQYTDTKKSGGWFSSDKKNTSWNALGGDADAQFAKVIIGLGASIGEAASLLGVGGDAFTQRLNGFVIDIGKISLKGLSGAEIQEQLEAVFSKLGDDMARFGVAGLEQFQQVGEGYFETLTRVAANYANLDSILASSGASFGQVGMVSIAARERLIALAGGIDELASAQANFNDNFLTEAERLAPVQKYVTDQLAAMGLQSLDTRDKFKDYVLGLANGGKLATEAGAAQYTALLALADAFAKTHAATVDLTKSEQEIADERKDLQDQLDELTMTSAQLLAKQRNALDASNRALFDQIQVATAAKKAQDEARSSLGTFLTQMTSFATSVAGFNNSLVLGSLSGLTPEHQLEEARRQYEQTRIAALAGDATAQGALQGIENTFLGLSQKLNGGDATYLADLAAVMKANDELAHWAAGKVDVAQASLDALNKQVDGITRLNATMQTVAQGMQYQPTLTGNAAMPALSTPLPVAIDYSAYGTAITAPLIAEIKLLREEVRGRREDANRQTGDSNNVTIAATQQAAQTIVTGVREAVTDGAYAASNDTRKPT